MVILPGKEGKLKKAGRPPAGRNNRPTDPHIGPTLGELTYDYDLTHLDFHVRTLLTLATKAVRPWRVVRGKAVLVKRVQLQGGGVVSRYTACSTRRADDPSSTTPLSEEQVSNVRL